MFIKKLVLFLSLAVLFTGCTSRTQLSYRPIYPISASKFIPVSVDEFEDDRDFKEAIGSKNNAYGMPIITVYADNPVSDWVTSAFEEELKRACYDICDKDSSEYQVEGTIKRAYATSQWTYRGLLHLKIKVIKKDEVVFTKVYNTNCAAGLNLMARSKKIAGALEKNLQRVCSQFITDLNDSIEQSPS